MVEFRTHGNFPFEIVVLHGGPGAWGEMAPVADHISADYGIIEPFFLEPTLQGQLLELKHIFTLHKLERVEVDLDRLNDVITMVKEQMDSLETAAKKAKMFQELKVLILIKR